jgi:photosynthetic reaction center cytochrome c subunit
MNRRHLLIASAATLPLLLSACEIGPKRSTQWGPNGAALNQVVKADGGVKEVPIPANVYDTPDDSGPRAGVTYQNVQVLAGVSTERFNHLMAQMNNWVAPQAGNDPNNIGCNYCHNPNNMASDEKYPKVVARRMIQMTQNINANWTSHVQGTGVTCWTCHRGNTIPLNRWSNDAPEGMTIVNNKRGQNTPDPRTAYASLPYGGFQGYLAGPGGFNARVASDSSHPSPNHVVSTKNAERTYGVMMHMSQSLGVNCTYCHNSQGFSQWKLSSTQRSTAWYGTRMVRQANYEYVTPLAGTLPADQKGPHGDPWKINCATCHQGVYKPMRGVSMRAENPTLWPASYSDGTQLAMNQAPMTMAPKADPNATAASCDADFARALAGKTIEFDTGKATIRAGSTALLDTLTTVAGRCSNFRMSIEGHTDAVGNPASNLALSQARAAAVEKYIAAKGIADAQMVATGFGQTRLIDTSGTPAGNQKNRRIEINVAGK